MSATKIHTLKNVHGFKELRIGDEVRLKKTNRPYTIVDMSIDLGSATLTLDDGIQMIDVSEGEVVREKLNG